MAAPEGLLKITSSWFCISVAIYWLELNLWKIGVAVLKRRYA